MLFQNSVERHPNPWPFSLGMFPDGAGKQEKIPLAVRRGKSSAFHTPGKAANSRPASQNFAVDLVNRSYMRFVI